MRLRVAAVVVGAVLSLAALVPIQADATPAQPASAHPWLQLHNAFFIGRQAVTVPHRVVAVVGGEWPYVAGQWVTLRVSWAGRVIETRELALRPSPRGNYGEFHGAFASPGAGRMLISVTHSATPALASFYRHRRLTALDTQVGFGSRGLFVSLIQQRLAALRFYIPQSGRYDQATGLALDAYHRLLGWGTDQTLDSRTIAELLSGTGAFRVRFPGHGRHAEGDLSLQLLALINGSTVDAIYPISSGKPSTPTILGDFHVYLKVPGYLPDGMFDSNFFYGNYAIHGYDPAPDHPASHGCMRLPIPDALSVYDWLAIGDWVDVYN